MTDAPTDPPRRHYLDKSELARFVRAYQRRRTRYTGEALGLCFILIAGGVWDRHHFSGLERDDFVSECCLLFLRLVRAKKVDPDQNPFSYLTTCAVRHGLRLRDRAAARVRRERQYRAVVLDVHGRLTGRAERRRVLKRLDDDCQQAHECAD